MQIDPALLSNVELLCLDAGNVVIFLDHERLARILRGLGFETTAAALNRSEGLAKIAIETNSMVDVAWTHRGAPGAAGWGRMLATTLHGVGVPKEALAPSLDAIWTEHVELNLWSVVPPGLRDALNALRQTGARVAIVSNSEGMLERLFRDLGIHDAFDTIVDSGVVGVEKPAPEIFRMAMDRCAATPATSVHLGDTYASDTLGARASDIRTALVDVHGHMAGRHLDVVRVPGAVEFAHALTQTRQKSRTHSQGEESS